MDQLRALRYFISVAELKSFSKAAEIFSVPPSSLSRRVADLEESLGASLLKRSTRSVQLTEVGDLYFHQVRNILAQLEQSDEAVRNYQSKPMGHLRISSMAYFGELMVLPLLDEFRNLYPDIVLDINFSDEVTTFGRDDVDIAIRGGYVPEERIQAVRLMDNEFVPVASPDYLKAYGVPESVFDLRNHGGLFFRTPRGPSPWLCELEGEWHDVSGKPIAISNNAKWLGHQAVTGKGIMMAPRWTLSEYLESGELVELSFDSILRVTQNTDMAMYLLYQRQRYHVPKVKAAVDFFKVRIGKPV